MRKALFLVWTLMFLLAAAVNAIPQQINFQGILKDSAGVNVEGTVDITFAIYAAASGGTALWSETQSGVSVEAGIYNVRLGSGTPLPHSVFADGSTRYLGIKVGADSEMAPRLPMISVPFAFRAASAEVADLAYTAQSVSSAINADTVDGYHATNEATPNTLLPLDGNGAVNLSTSGEFGAFLDSSSSTGRGVFGTASNTTGTNYGGYFSADGNTGIGVYGEGKGAGARIVNTQIGGIAITAEAATLGGVGISALGGSGASAIGVAGASAGTGVKGITTATGRGIHGVAGASATGVYAENTSTGNALYIAGRLGSATGAGNCVGTGTISSGSNNTTIANAAVTDNSLIFITPLTYGTSATYEALVPYNINSPAADQFGVRIANTSRAAPTNIDFIYLIIN